MVDLAVDAKEIVKLYITDRARRDPANRWYESRTGLAFLQDGEIFTYRPAAKVEAARRAYAGPASPYLQPRACSSGAPFASTCRVAIVSTCSATPCSLSARRAEHL